MYMSSSIYMEIDVCILTVRCVYLAVKTFSPRPQMEWGNNPKSVFLNFNFKYILFAHSLRSSVYM